jgi:hypothetical protein
MWPIASEKVSFREAHGESRPNQCALSSALSVFQSVQNVAYTTQTRETKAHTNDCSDFEAGNDHPAQAA